MPKIDYLLNQAIGVGAIDTTGVWVWEAEEILSYYITSKFETYKSASKVLELGAGCSGLAGLSYYKKWVYKNRFDNKGEKVENPFVLITDGKK